MELANFGLQIGDTVRWQRKPGGRWHELTVKGVEKDGSLSLLGTQGFRALMPDRLERKQHGPKGKVVWVPLSNQETT